MRRFFRRHRAAISLTVAVSLFAASVLFRAIPGRQSPMTGTKSLKALTAKMEQNGSSAESADRQPATTAKKRAQRKQKPEFFSLHQSAPCCEAGQLLQDADMAAVARYVATVWDGRKPDLEDPPVRFGTPAQAVYVAVRGKGARLAEAWETHGSTAEALVAAVGRAKAAVPAGKAKTVDTLEINLSHNYRQYRLGDRAGRQLFDNVYRGVRGLEIEYNGIVERYGPTYVIASNRGNENLLDRFRRHHRIDRRAMEKDSRVFSFEGEQLLVKLGTEPGAMLMQRGNMLVDPAEVNAANTGKLADLAAAWLRHNVHGDGRITYKYWPSAKREAQSNNMIRQWMATVALGMLAQKTGKPEDWGLMKRNINYNLNRFYSSEDGHGLIEYQNQVKLGAVALAAMAILEHPERSRWADQEQALQRTIDALWHEDGSFSTYFKPKGLQRNQNFYPGEALLYWALLYERDRNPELLRRFLMSYEYYRAWHLDPANRNPAFIPWHTQAYYRVWKLTGNDALKDFVFTMNDWLLPIQQWPRETPFPDTRGRFYDPGRPFGPPHASSTGVYLEGLIDAFELAREVGDSERMARYRLAVNRGLRSVMQLQFADEVDLFYVSPSMHKYVRGGIRTTVYDNVIRCDNVQHNLMAVLKILDRFEAEDYGHY